MEPQVRQMPQVRQKQAALSPSVMLPAELCWQAQMDKRIYPAPPPRTDCQLKGLLYTGATGVVVIGACVILGW